MCFAAYITSLVNYDVFQTLTKLLFVPKPNQNISKVLWQERIREMLHLPWVEDEESAITKLSLVRL